jgi:hypothetical protein
MVVEFDKGAWANCGFNSSFTLIRDSIRDKWSYPFSDLQVQILALISGNDVLPPLLGMGATSLATLMIREECRTLEEVCSLSKQKHTARPRRSSTLHGGAHFPKENVLYTWLVVQHVEQLRFLAS